MRHSSKPEDIQKLVKEFQRRGQSMSSHWRRNHARWFADDHCLVRAGKLPCPG